MLPGSYSAWGTARRTTPLGVIDGAWIEVDAAFCGVWMAAEQHLEQVEAGRRAFDER